MFAVEELHFIENNLSNFLDSATEEAFSSYEAIKEAVESGEVDLKSQGKEFPDIQTHKDVWKYMVLETIVIDKKSKLQVRLGYLSPWDIEHDFGIYITNREYKYSGTSV